MLPDRVSNPGPPTYESGALPIALRGPAPSERVPIYTEVCEYLEGLATIILREIIVKDYNMIALYMSPYPRGYS